MIPMRRRLLCGAGGVVISLPICYNRPPHVLKDMTTENSDLWIFGYGSLMWRPGFDFVERLPVRLIDIIALSVSGRIAIAVRLSDWPVLGLDRGGSCLGDSYRIAREKRDAVLGYLHEREMITGVYNPRDLSVFDSCL